MSPGTCHYSQRKVFLHFIRGWVTWSTGDVGEIVWLRAQGSGFNIDTTQWSFRLFCTALYGILALCSPHLFFSLCFFIRSLYREKRRELSKGHPALMQCIITENILSVWAAARWPQNKRKDWYDMLLKRTVLFFLSFFFLFFFSFFWHYNIDESVQR